jgi:hypothetical protein
VPAATWIVIGVVFAVGLLLLGISSAMLRSLKEEAPSISRPAPRSTWPRLVDDALADADARLRLDMVERLALIDSDWSRGVLEWAREEERDPQVRAAIDAALTN